MKTVVVMDMQDYNTFWEMTLEEVAGFLSAIWGDDEEMTESEFAAYFDALQDDVNTENTSELDNKLQGIGYTLFENEQDRLEFIENEY
jgi:hypothetical protein